MTGHLSPVPAADATTAPAGRTSVGLGRPTLRRAGLALGLGCLVALWVAPAGARTNPIEAVAWAKAYSEHPQVREVRRDGYLTVSTRARVLSEGLPLDRALAIVSAMTLKQARAFKVAQGVARSLRARHSIGPSGALLGKAIPLTKLTPRQALLLGWARAREARGKRKVLAKRGPTITSAGALQLLEAAAAGAPDAQAPQLALALARAAVAPKRGAAACAAWRAVQSAARDGKKASVALPAAEAAIRGVKHLARACPRKARAPFKRPVQLAPPPAEHKRPIPRAGRPPRPGRSRAATGGQGIAFAVLAPVFKGYLNVPLVRRLARRERLDEVKLWRVMKTDPTGDVTLAVLNASVLMRRLAPDDTFDATLQAVMRVRGTLDLPKKQLAKLRVSQLSGVQAMALAYARALQGRGLGQLEPPGDAPVLKASPRQLFAHARQRVPANAALGPILFMAHKIDLQRQGSPCAARKRADATRFVVGKSQLPAPAKQALDQAMATVQAQCPQGAGRR